MSQGCSTKILVRSACSNIQKIQTQKLELDFSGNQKIDGTFEMWWKLDLGDVTNNVSSQTSNDAKDGFVGRSHHHLDSGKKVENCESTLL